MLSFIAPLYNQEKFIRAWCEFTTKNSDDVIALDTGCTDRTFDIIAEYPIKTLEYKVKKKYEWPEGYIRNMLIDEAKNEWIFWLDGDELLCDKFVENLPDLVNTTQDVIWFKHMTFWMSPNLLRTRDMRSYHNWCYFYPSKMWKMFRNRPYIRYEHKDNHAQLKWRGINPRASSRYVDIPYYHYHHCLALEGAHNRANEYLKNLNTMTYFDNHPEEVRFYEWWDGSLLFPARERLWDESYVYTKRSRNSAIKYMQP